MDFSIYFYTEWISDEVKQIPKALFYCHLSVKWFLYQTIKSQDIKPIINRAYVFVYPSVARAVLLQKLEQEPYNPPHS